MTGQLIVLTGKSGSGKSTIATRLMESLCHGTNMSDGANACIIIDQDQYWSNTPPTVVYENLDVKLYDSVDAIIWDALCDDLVRALKEYDYVIFAAFLIPKGKFQDLFGSASMRAFEFDISGKTSIKRRCESKSTPYTARGKTFNPKFDKWMVKSYAVPLYKSWIKSFRKRYNPTLITAELPEDTVWSEFMNAFPL